MQEMEAELGTGNQDSFASKVTTSLIKHLLVNTGVVTAKALVGKEKLKDLDALVKHSMSNMPYMINDFIDKHAENNAAALWLKENIFPQISGDRGNLDNTLKKNMTDSVPFDVLTRRSIIEIIPGYLAKILQKSSITAEATKFSAMKNMNKQARTKFNKLTNIEEEVFDIDTEDFISASEFKQKNMEDLFGTQKERTDSMNEALTTLYAGYSKKEGADLKSFEENLPDIAIVLRNMAKHGKVVKPKQIISYLEGAEVSDSEQSYLDFIFRGVKRENRNKVAEILKESFFKKTATGKEVEDADVFQDVTQAVRDLGMRSDEYVGKIGTMNATGGKRHMKNILGDRSRADVEKFQNKLLAKYISKHTKEGFLNNPKLKQELHEKVKEYGKQKGLDFNAIDEILHDMDFDSLKANLESGSKQKREEFIARDAARGKEDTSEFKDRFKGAVAEEIEETIGKTFRKQFEKLFSTSKTVEDIDLGGYGVPTGINGKPITRKEDIPTRDDPQVSGPGVYVQGSEKEFHIPFEKAKAFWDKAAESIKASLSGDTATSMKNKIPPEAKEFWDKAAESFGGFINNAKVDKAKSKLPKTMTEAGTMASEAVDKAKSKLPEGVKDFIKQKSEAVSGLVDKAKSKLPKTDIETKVQSLISEMKKITPKTREEAEAMAKELLNKTRDASPKSRAEAEAMAIELLNKVKSKLPEGVTDTLDKLKKEASGKMESAKVAFSEMFNKARSKTKSKIDDMRETVSENIAKRSVNKKNKNKDTDDKNPSEIEEITKSVKNIEKILEQWTSTKMTLDAEALQIMSQQLMAQLGGAGFTKYRSMRGMFKSGIASVGRGAANLGSFYMNVANKTVGAISGTIGTGLKIIKDLSSKGVFASAAKGIGKGIGGLASLGKKGMEAYFGLIGRLFGLTPGAAGVAGKVLSKLKAIPGKMLLMFKNKAQDVYVKGKIEVGNPAIKASDISMGNVRDEKGNILKSVYEIKGPLFDKDGKVLISKEDFSNGIVDSKGRPFTKTGVFMDYAKRLIGGAVKVAKTGLKIAGKVIKTGFNIASNIAGRVGRAGAAFFGINVSKKGIKVKDGGAPIVVANLKALVTDKLQEIIDLMKSMKKDMGGAGADKKESVFSSLKDKLGNKGAGGGILSKAKDAIGDALPAAGGIAKTAGSLIRTGGMALAGAGAAVAGGVSTAALVGTGAAVVAGGAAYMGYKAYKETAELEETGQTDPTKAAATISKGTGDHGGKSYGAYQLASKQGNVEKFLKASGYDKEFKGLSVGSKEFDEKWVSVAKSDPKFYEAQRNYSYGANLHPMIAALKKNKIDLTKRSIAVQQMLVSTANQYGPSIGADVITKALTLDGGTSIENLTDEDLIRRVYKFKISNVSVNFKKSKDNWPGLIKRFEREGNNLAAMATGGKGEIVTAKQNKENQKAGKNDIIQADSSGGEATTTTAVAGGKPTTAGAVASGGSAIAANDTKSPVEAAVAAAIPSTAPAAAMAKSSTVAESVTRASMTPIEAPNKTEPNVTTSDPQISILKDILSVLTEIRDIKPAEGTLSNPSVSRISSDTSSLLVNEIRNLINAIVDNGGINKPEKAPSSESSRTVSQTSNRTNGMDLSKQDVVFA